MGDSPADDRPLVGEMVKVYPRRSFGTYIGEVVDLQEGAGGWTMWVEVDRTQSSIYRKGSTYGVGSCADWERV